jgi:phospho-N-acetylmuramoyl-pentapeptide-transferase
MTVEMIKILVPAALTFLVGIAITPLVTYYLYKYQVWKKVGGKRSFDGTTATEFNRLHADGETKTPRMGGIIIWAPVLVVILILALLAHIFPMSLVSQFNFLSRGQTWIPFTTLMSGAFVGFWNDVLDVQPGARGLRLRERLFFVVVLSAYIGWWLYSKIGIDSINIPFWHALYLGPFVILFFIALSFCLYASGVIDGIDGLSGGIFASIFASYTIIAFIESQYNLASLCASIVGGLLAFLWFNVPPARFYMSETGTMGLTLSLASIAFLTDAHGGGIGIAVLPIIGFLLVITVLSNIIQITSKKLFKKKVFLVAPLHHHFESLGWSSAKVTMRYWILSIMFAFIGVICALISVS